MADIKDLTEQKQALLATILPANREIIGAEMAELDADMLPVDERKELIRSAEGDHEKSQMLAEARIRRIFNNIAAETIGASFMELEVLADDESPLYIVETADKVYINYVGQNGKTAKRQLVVPESPFLVPLQWLSSEIMEYTKRSMYHGDLKNFDRVNKLIEVEIRNQTDVNCMTLLAAGAEASFSTGVLAPHRLVDDDNLPTGNYLDLKAEGTLNINVFKAILAYCDVADVTALSIHVPSAHTKQMRDFVDLVAGTSSTGDIEKPSLTIPSEMRTELFRSGKLNDFFGKNIDIVGHNTLPLKYGWVATDKPAGYLVTKPSLNETILDDSVAMRQKNKESLMARKVEAYYQPLPNRVNYLKFRYAT